MSLSNNKYQPYTQIPRHDHDSDNDIELQSVSHQNNANNANNHSHSNSGNLITNLLKLTAHRRIRQMSNQNDTIITIDDDDDNDQQTTTECDEIDLNETHCQSSDDLNESSENENYDDFVLLLYLDGTKKKIGIMNTWKIGQIKTKYFGKEIADGKNVRLIYRGKLLLDGVHLNTYNIASNGFIHVSISKNGNLYSHKSSNATQRMRSMESSDTNYDNFDDGMDDEAIARRLQERELEMSQLQRANGQFSFGDFGENVNGQSEEDFDVNRARREFLCGMFLGSIAGIWILIFLILAQRNGGYSRRFRLGVTLGVAINLIIQLTYQVPNSPTSAEDNGNESVTETESGATAENDTSNVVNEGE